MTWWYFRKLFRNADSPEALLSRDLEDTAMSATFSTEVGSVGCPLCSSMEQACCLAEAERALKKCLRCGVYILEPRPLDAKLRSYFSDDYIENFLGLSRFGRNRDNVLSRVARAIQKTRKSGRILDIGCAGAYFLNAFFSKSQWRMEGVELSRFAAEQASESGIKVHVGDIQSANYTAHQFDVVTILDAIYYFSDPRRDLMLIREILEPDGVLAIETPLAQARIWRNQGWVARMFRTSRTILHHDDLLLYDLNSISYLLNESGFEVTKIVPCPGNRQQRLLLDALYSSFFYIAYVLWMLSFKRLMIAPRFLTLASPKAIPIANRH
ncbi:MAG: putative Methyltransferase type 11 [Acidobacteriaceae bacterium]|nr:putative Methyltransferase type 11 [Acidobacteriaceae bacterium]